MKATWINNSVEFVQWKGDNIEEIKDFVFGHRVFMSVDNTSEIYIEGIGVAGIKDYIYKSGYYDYAPILISSWKVFPRIINEDIGSGLN